MPLNKEPEHRKEINECTLIIYKIGITNIL